MSLIFKVYSKKLSASGILLAAVWGSLIFASCKKTDYLDVNASERPPLVAKMSFVNARPVNQGLLFYTYTTQVTPTAVSMNKATPYIDAQFGLVQINYTASGSSSYLASRVFGSSADFTASGGPNGPIAGYYHTVFALKGKAANFAADSVMLFFDDLSAPPAGSAKVRFVNIAQASGPVDVSFKGGNVFSNVPYGSAAGAVLSGPGLNAFSIGPFKSVPAGTGSFVIRSTTDGTTLKMNGTEWDNYTFAEGKIYTIFITGDASSAVVGTAIQHN